MFRFLTAGESHGQCLTALVEGIPAGLKINLDEINERERSYKQEVNSKNQESRWVEFFAEEE